MPAHASASSWTKSQTHYTVYFSGGFASMYFGAPASTPESGTAITGVNYAWNTYNNGNTSEVVTLCYQKPYTSVDYLCADVPSQTTTVDLFNGQSANGSFKITHALVGGTYPVFGGGVQDTVTVNYTP